MKKGKKKQEKTPSPKKASRGVLEGKKKKIPPSRTTEKESPHRKTQASRIKIMLRIRKRATGKKKKGKASASGKKRGIREVGRRAHTENGRKIS